MKLRNLLYFLTIAILIDLLIASFLQIDIAPSKNEALTYFSKNNVERMHNIDSLKSEAKKWIDINRENFKTDSRDAKKRTIALAVLLIIQIILIKKATRDKNSKTT